MEPHLQAAWQIYRIIERETGERERLHEEEKGLELGLE